MLKSDFIRLRHILDAAKEAVELARGVYFYNIQAGNFTATKKMIVKK